MKIKDKFLNLSSKKIEEIQKIINKLKTSKPRINMTIKYPSIRQVLVLMSSDNVTKIIALFNKHIANINRALKKIKSEVMTGFIGADNKYLSIITNKVTFNSDLNIIEKYIKNIDIINYDDVKILRLPQSKSYLKILGILYLIESTNFSILFNVIKRVLQSTHIFNDVTLASKPRIIKASNN